MMPHDPSGVVVNDEGDVVKDTFYLEVGDVTAPYLIHSRDGSIGQQISKTDHTRTIRSPSVITPSLNLEAALPANGLELVSAHKHRINLVIHGPAVHRWMILTNLLDQIYQKKNLLLLTFASL